MTEKCELCGEPMPAGEEMFKYHGSSGPCPKPALRATESYYDPAPPRDSARFHPYTLRMAQLEESRDQWKATVAEQAAQIRTLTDALQKLRNEVSGFIGAFENELRDAGGNTNVSVLKLRIAEAESVLAGVASPRRET